MLSKRKLCWFSLAVALVAAALLVVGCGESKKEPTTPGDQATAKGTPIGQGDTTGVTDTEIKLGTHFPLSQNPAAAYAPIAYGMKAFFDYINLQGVCTVEKSPSSSLTTTTTHPTP